jgi:Glycine zipper
VKGQPNGAALFCSWVHQGSAIRTAIFSSFFPNVTQQEGRKIMEATLSRKHGMATTLKTHAGVWVTAVLFLVAGCAQPMNKREKGFLIGGGMGAATGAIIGAAVGHPGAGAAIGGAMGALGGGLIGDQLHGQEVQQNEQQQAMTLQQRELQQQRLELEQMKKEREEMKKEQEEMKKEKQERELEELRAELDELRSSRRSRR